MVDDEKLVTRLRELLAESDMDTTTEKMLRKKLEEEFDQDLSDKKALIREEVDKYINEVQEEKDAAEDDGDAEEEADGGSSDEGSADGKSTKRRKAASAKASSKKQKTEGGGGKARGGFAKLVPVSDELAEVIGKEEASRSELTKFFWDYFKKNELLDPNDKRYVKCDETLKKLFGVNRFLAFGIQKQLSAHIRK